MCGYMYTFTNPEQRFVCPLAAIYLASQEPRQPSYILSKKPNKTSFTSSLASNWIQCPLASTSLTVKFCANCLIMPAAAPGIFNRLGCEASINTGW
ncbi:hypothetical protein I7I50_03450 [Histoplasma capsulatum G186AR]|uniref:Uncharacterized protein n=1 Tax=Ajellomyces capsulatus TaxID=5037 RepID=A0A8H7YPD9_AJECA|nr:hypothetical protein I7I52_04357 [Histoplasma capsulatum]QSS74594.1 hypothetical protein I7I50_03450 [Histoplasma capsulatum G186AR]